MRLENEFSESANTRSVFLRILWLRGICTKYLLKSCRIADHSSTFTLIIIISKTFQLTIWNRPRSACTAFRIARHLKMIAPNLIPYWVRRNGKRSPTATHPNNSSTTFNDVCPNKQDLCFHVLYAEYQITLGLLISWKWNPPAEPKTLKFFHVVNNNKVRRFQSLCLFVIGITNHHWLWWAKFNWSNTRTTQK